MLSAGGCYAQKFYKILQYNWQLKTELPRKPLKLHGSLVQSMTKEISKDVVNASVGIPVVAVS